MVDYLWIVHAAFAWRQMQNRSNLIKFDQTAAADQLVVLRQRSSCATP
jgi:hypothetical protein